MTVLGVHFTVGRGCTTHRATWWPAHGQVAFRVWREWWAGLYWKPKIVTEPTPEG